MNQTNMLLMLLWLLQKEQFKKMIKATGDFVKPESSIWKTKINGNTKRYILLEKRQQIIDELRLTEMGILTIDEKIKLKKYKQHK